MEDGTQVKPWSSESSGLEFKNLFANVKNKQK